MDALVIVDVQNDFCPGGALAVDDGDAVVPVVNELAQEADWVAATRDWHPGDHGSFIEQGGIWPVHCVAGTAGAELHPGVDRTAIDAVVDKGLDRDLPGYSGCEATDLVEQLRARGAHEVHVAGLALDYCVKHTSLDLARQGFAVTVHRAGTRPVEVEVGDGERAERELRAAGVRIV